MVGYYTRVFTVILKTRFCGVERLGVAALVKRLRNANWSSLRTQTYFRLSIVFAEDKRQPEIRLR